MFEDVRFIDLTHPLDENVPTWTGGCGFSCTQKVDYDQGLRAQSLRLHAGVGTHMDAPSHFIPGGKSMADMDIHDLILHMHVIHKECDADDVLLVEDIEAYERDNGPIQRGSFVAFHSGWDKYWHTPERYRNPDEQGVMRFPTLSPKAADYLIDRGIKGIGIDTLSPDPEVTRSTTPFPVHHKILGAGGYIVENLANLGSMGAGAYAMLFPLPIIGGTESPIRAVGIVSV